MTSSLRNLIFGSESVCALVRNSSMTLRLKGALTNANLFTNLCY